MSERHQQTTLKHRETESSRKMESNSSQFASKDEKDLTMEQKLELLDREFRLLYEFCKNSGYQPKELETAAAPFLDTSRKVSRKKLRSKAVTGGKIMALFLVLGFVLFYVDPVYRCLCFMSRKTTIKMLPYWDWTSLYEEHCLIENPYYQGHQISEEDCMTCESLNSVPAVSNLSHAVMTETYLKGMMPVIVTDAMLDWPERTNIDLKYLTELYINHPIVKDYMSCDFFSNVRVKFGNHRVLLRKIMAGEVGPYFAHWENCFKEPAKIFRGIFPRPYFLPPMVELADTNLIFISSDFNAKSFKTIDPWSSMLAFAQIKGRNKIRIWPKIPCEKMCNEFEDTLEEGEIVVVPYFLWNFSYLPIGGEENIAFGVGGNYD